MINKLLFLATVFTFLQACSNGGTSTATSPVVVDFNDDFTTFDDGNLVDTGEWEVLPDPPAMAQGESK